MKAGGIEWYYHPTQEYYASKYEGIELFIFPVAVIPIRWKVVVKGIKTVSFKKTFEDFEEAAKSAICVARLDLGVPKRPMATGF